jgi:RNA polymerase sigma-70 factor (ECF subfamily)
MSITLNSTNIAPSEGTRVPSLSNAGSAPQPRAFTQIYHEQYDTIATYIYRRLGDRAATEDVTSETFLAAFRAYSSYHDRGLPIECWLYRIAGHEIARWTRKRSAQIRLAHVARWMRLGNRAESTPLASDRLHAALASLPSEQQEALVLVEVEGLSIEHAALVQRVASGTVKSRLSRAREALRVRLQASS